MPEISSDIADDGDQWEVNSSIVEDSSNLSKRYESIWKKDAPQALRKEIMGKFVEELKKK